jgi:hypothetical protein
MGLVEYIYSISLMALDVLAMMIYLIYFIAEYAHPQDSSFGGSTFARIIIYIGYFLGYLFILMVQFDIFATEHNGNIIFVYYIVQWAQLIFVFICGPSFLVYYESNEASPLVSQV